ncbi:cytochrome c [Flaviaesturariibacter amylovorans]|uniref:Cytochrome c domain-containing protein n=1 Tax=Flaviaesturariibacter amylovorans TaxID=1084520 RepID=A0ABP8H552_9BACT
MKTRKVLAALLIVSGILVACGGGGGGKQATGEAPSSTEPAPATSPAAQSELPAVDVKLTTPLDQKMVASGKATYELKCQSCHKLTDEKLVGPGWKGVTQKRKPEWIINMITNVEIMLEKDPEAQKLLEECLVRMPNQNLSGTEAREVLEFMRSNDGVK